MDNAKNLLAKALIGVHQQIYRISGGRLLGSAKGMPVLELETIGRRSGKARTTMLTAPVHSDTQLVIVASKAGADHHPAWFLNLRDNPSVKVTMKGSTRAMKARVANADEKAELWPQIVAANDGYAGYQAKTERDIPVVILTY